jgi:PAS domain S-box-containing protein
MTAESARRETAGPINASHVAAPVGSLDPAFAGLARLAASICRAPWAAVVLSASGSTWCSASGPLSAASLPDRDPFFVDTTRAVGLHEVGAASRDERFRDVECLASPSRIRFYAGIALRDARGEVLGTIAVYDIKPRRLSPEEHAALQLLAQQCVSQLELHARLNEHLVLSAAAPMPAADQADAALVRSLVENAPVAIYHTDGTGNSRYFNPAYRRMFGLAEGQGDGGWIEGVHPDDRARLEDEWADFQARPRAVRFEYRSDPDRYGMRFLAEQVVPAEGANGFVGTITDVTELSAARDELRRLETLFRNTFEQAPIGVAYANRDGRFLRTNRAFRDLLGAAPGEIERRSIGDLTYGEDLASTRAKLDDLWNGDVEFVDIEKRYLRMDGSVLWVRTTSALVRGESAVPDCSVEFLRDISVRKKMEAELLENQTLLEAVIANLPVALLASDSAGSVTHHNGAAEELFSIAGTARSAPQSPAGYLLTADVYLADGATPVPPEQQPLPRALRGEPVRNVELVIVPPGSAPRTTLANARRLAGPDGQTLGAVAILEDITERKLAELELERVHKQLMAASRQAGMAEVATNVLHNVGNILNSVNISASLVTERIKQSKAPGLRRVAALLAQQGAQMGEFLASDERGKRIPGYLASLGEQLVSDQAVVLQELASLRDNLEHIKDTVTMQQGYAKLCGVIETVNVADLVEDSLRLNAGAFVRHGVTLRREFSEVPPITVDKHKVLQILVNLVRNAKYACDESGRRDKLLTLRVEGMASGVRISVIDNGVGIAPENMGRLFTHGFTTRQSGHGFGLHSGALAARDLGGSLRAESGGPGLGAAFILELPTAPREVAHG